MERSQQASGTPCRVSVVTITNSLVHKLVRTVAQYRWSETKTVWCVNDNDKQQKEKNGLIVNDIGNVFWCLLHTQTCEKKHVHENLHICIFTVHITNVHVYSGFLLGGGRREGAFDPPAPPVTFSEIHPDIAY